MIEFGETLRRTRESQGLTPSQVAEKTRLLVQQIEALEREDFSRIAAPIYGRGFVKLYCEALGLDPRPLVEEFMAIYTGSRQPSIRMRKREDLPPPAAAPAASAASVASAAESEEPPAASGVAMRAVGAEAPSAQDAAEDPAGGEPAMPSAIEPPPPPAPSLGRHPQRAVRKSLFDEPPPPARQTMFPDDEEEDGYRFRIPAAFWRILALAAAAAVLLWLLFLGARFLYNVGMGRMDEAGGGGHSAPQQQTAAQTRQAAQAQAATAADAPAKPAPAVPAKRTPYKIKPLYID